MKHKLDKEFLQKEYIDYNKSMREISLETGISATIISRALKKFNIPKKIGGSRKGKPNKGVFARKNDIIIGYRYYHLVVKDKVKGGLLCLCDCGNEKILKSSRIRLQQVKSCGCLLKKSGKNHHLFKGFGEISQATFNKIRQKAIDRNIDFDITINQLNDLFLRQKKKCAISGVEIKFKDSHKDKQTASLDRIDSSKPYIVSNLQWVHKTINQMKWTIDQKEFVEWCKVVAKHAK